MKRKDIIVNETIVYIKKDRQMVSWKPYKVIELRQKNKTGKGNTVWAILNNKKRTRIRISDLTDVSCHVMTCGNCKYHPRE